MAESKDETAAAPKRRAAKAVAVPMLARTGFVLGDRTVVKGGATYDKDGKPFTDQHPLVKAHANLFVSVEAATAGPGERRAVAIPPPRRPTSSKRRDRAEAEKAKED